MREKRPGRAYTKVIDPYTKVIDPYTVLIEVIFIFTTQF